MVAFDAYLCSTTSASRRRLLLAPPRPALHTRPRGRLDLAHLQPRNAAAAPQHHRPHVPSAPLPPAAHRHHPARGGRLRECVGQWPRGFTDQHLALCGDHSGGAAAGGQQPGHAARQDAGRRCDGGDDYVRAQRQAGAAVVCTWWRGNSGTPSPRQLVDT